MYVCGMKLVFCNNNRQLPSIMPYKQKEQKYI